MISDVDVMSLHSIFVKTPVLSELIEDFHDLDPFVFFNRIISILKIHNNLPRKNEGEQLKNLREKVLQMEEGSKLLDDEIKSLKEKYKNKETELSNLTDDIPNIKDKARKEGKHEGIREATDDEALAIRASAIGNSNGRNLGVLETTNKHLEDRLREEKLKVERLNEKIEEYRDKERLSLHSQKKGAAFEFSIYDRLNELSTVKTIHKTNNIGHSGDFLVDLRDSNKRVLIDAKDYKKNVPNTEIMKIKDDLKTNQECCAAILIASGGIANMDRNSKIIWDETTRKPIFLFAFVNDHDDMLLIDDKLSKIAMGEFDRTDTEVYAEKYRKSTLKYFIDKKESDLNEIKQIKIDSGKKIKILENNINKINKFIEREDTIVIYEDIDDKRKTELTDLTIPDLLIIAKNKNILGMTKKPKQEIIKKILESEKQENTTRIVASAE